MYGHCRVGDPTGSSECCGVTKNFDSANALLPSPLLDMEPPEEGPETLRRWVLEKVGDRGELLWADLDEKVGCLGEV